MIFFWKFGKRLKLKPGRASRPCRNSVMKKKVFVVVLATVTVFVVAGCSTTPKASLSVPVYYPQYTYGQEPEKHVFGDSGTQWKKHAKELQDMRLRHESAMTAIEYRAEEQRLAREKGLAPQQPQMQSGAPVYRAPSPAPQLQQQYAPPAAQPAGPGPTAYWSGTGDTVPYYDAPAPPPVPVSSYAGYGYPAYGPSYGPYGPAVMPVGYGFGGGYYARRSLFGVSFVGAVNPAYGGGLYYERGWGTVPVGCRAYGACPSQVRQTPRMGAGGPSGRR